MGLFPNQIINLNDYDIEPTHGSLRYRQDEAKVNQGQMALTHWQLHIFAFYFPLSSNTISTTIVQQGLLCIHDQNAGSPVPKYNSSYINSNIYWIQLFHVVVNS